MPYINVRILRGATPMQKRAVVADLTRSLVERLGKKPEHIHIVIDEIDPENWGYAGKLTTELIGPGSDRWAGNHKSQSAKRQRRINRQKSSKHVSSS